MIDKHKVQLIRAAINQALAEVGEEHGFKIEAVGTAKFGSNHIDFKVLVSSVSEEGEVIDRDAETFKEYARLYGLDSDMLGAKFRSGTKIFTVVGAKTSNRAYPILLKNSMGKSFKSSPEQLKRMTRIG